MSFPNPQPDDGNMMELVRMLEPDAQSAAKELLALKPAFSISPGGGSRKSRVYIGQ